MKETRGGIFYTQLNEEQKATVAISAIDYSYERKSLADNCQECGACCYTFSIPGVKETGEVCPHLTEKHGQVACSIYENRPKECRDFSCITMPTNTSLQRMRIVELFSGKEKVRETVLFENTSFSASQE